MHTVDPLVLHHVLVDTIKVKRPPVAITYCRDHIPAGYEPATVVACGIVREAESGRRVYIDANHHDCYVGLWHLGLLPKAEKLITEGEYLTMAQGFFTPEAAKRNKAQSERLPDGSIIALAAAPLNDVPAGVQIDSVICVTDALHAMQLAGAASVREGTFPIGEVGPSACASIFATPMNKQNSVFATGDGGGRMHNRLAPGELFVTIPAHHFQHVLDLVANFRFDPARMRELIMPSHAPKAASHGD